MKKYRKEITEKDVVSKYICDKCGNTATEREFYESKEFISFSHSFGYGSSMDGTTISFDLCEKCFLDMIKDINYTKKDMY